MSTEEEIPLNSAAARPDAAASRHAHAPDGDISNIELLERILLAPQESTIPWEECTLPSLGLYYGWNSGLLPVRAMNQTAEKILATHRLAQSGQSIEYLFRECCQFPSGFDPVDMLLGDRVFLLYYIRGITHGPIYEFVVTCPGPECGEVTTHRYDLNELQGTIRYADTNLGPEPFKVVLPYLTENQGRECWVDVRFLRTSDSNNIMAKRKAMKKMVRPGGVRTRGTVDPRQHQQNMEALNESVNENMERMIVSVLGSHNVFQIRDFITKMHARDLSTIREWMRTHTPGIDSTVMVNCPECGLELTMELPITDSFFRPAQPGGAGS